MMAFGVPSPSKPVVDATVRTPWKPAISGARKRLAEQAATWSPDPDDGIRIVAD